MTSAVANARAETVRQRPAFDAFAPIWRLLTSVRFAVLFIGTLALIGLIGVLVPQIPEPMRGNDAAVSVWVDTQRGTFGPFTDTMHRLGLFSVFQARWFAIALGFLVVNVTVCTFNRWSPTFRNVFRPPVHVPETFYDRAHNRTRLDAVAPATVLSALRSMRFSIKTREEQGTTYVFADRFGWAQLATFVSHLALILFIAGGLVTSLTGFTANAFAGEGTTVPVFPVKDPNQLQIRIDDAVGRFGEAGNALDFRTHLTIFRNGEEVKSGTMTVNDPLEYGGYRFHQVAFWPSGAEIRIRDAATGNTVLHETFPLQDTTAAPVVTIAAADGTSLLRDTIVPTDFLDTASGTLVNVANGDGTSRLLWIGLTTTADDEWQLVAYDPAAADSAPLSSEAQLRVLQGQSGELAGLRVTFDDVAAVPSAIGVNVPGSAAPVLAQLTETDDGSRALTLVAEDAPAISLAEGEAVTLGGYTYIFEGAREFTGISVKRDSGAWFIWIATGMLVLGLAVTFYVPRRRLWLRINDEATSIAALAEKSGGFEKDMRVLATRMGVPVPEDLQEDR